MMSNGPRSARRSLHIGERVNSTPATSSSDFRTNERRKPSRCRCRSERLSCVRWRRMTCSPKSRSGPRRVARVAQLARQVEHDRDREQVVLARRSSSAPRAPRAGRWWRRRPSAARAAAAATAISCRTANASSDAPWSFGSSATRPRQKSEEITSVGRKCCAANVLLPEPEAPISTTRHGSGRSIFIARTPPSASAARPRRPPARPAGSAPCSRSAHADARRPRRELRARPLEAVVRVAQLARRQRLPHAVVLRVRRRHDDAAPAAPSRRRWPRRPPAAAGRSAR